MENFKFILLSIIILAGLGLLGYWAVRTIQPGDIYVSKQKQLALEEKNWELAKEIEELKKELAALQPSEPEQPSSPEPAPSKPASAPSKYQDLINTLQKLIDDNILIKEKSAGTKVGTLQTFLNTYNNTSKKVDNDFGPGTKTDVINFQKAEGLTADGEAGPATFQKMIDWLQKQQ